MAGIIRLNEDGLKIASNELKTQSSDLGELIARAQNTVGSLEQSWEGAAAESFRDQFAELKPGLLKAKELLNTIAVQIDQTLAAAQDLDNSIAGQYRG